MPNSSKTSVSHSGQVTFRNKSSEDIKGDRENFRLYSEHVSLTTKQQSCRLCADNSDIFPTSVFMENPVLLFLEMLSLQKALSFYSDFTEITLASEDALS